MDSREGRVIMANPRVSVTMASYNHHSYVRAAIESVLAQSFQDFEICVTDDGSTDGTADVLRAIDDPRLSVVGFPINRGACLAMNASIGRARGEYVAILNSDDVFMPEKLEKQVQFLDEHPEIGAVFAFPSFIDENGMAVSEAESFYRGLFRVENRPRHEWLRHLFFAGNVFCHPTVLIRRRCYDDVGLYSPALAQLPDYEMWIRLLGKYDVHVLPQQLIGFRVLKGQANASAPRAEVRVRVQWEMTRLLARYLEFDDALLLSIFPEIPVPALMRKPQGWTGRLAQRALVRVLGRNTEAGGDGAFATAQELPPRPLAWYLGELALAVGKPAHVVFGLDAMYRSCVAENDVDARHFIALSGSFDPFGILSGMPENRRLS
jgi:glycosyltransferase involved in cell wall biosynthesis